MKHRLISPFLLFLPCVAASCLHLSAASAATFTVTSTRDSGPGSLRQAILDANASHSAGLIQFHIPRTDANFNAASGAFTINVSAALPPLTVNGLVVDGTSQTAFTGNTNAKGPEIVLNGAGRLSSGLTINSANCTVRDVTVNGFAGNASTLTGGIKISGLAASGNRVEGCFLGTDADASAAVPNFDGILITSGAHNNHIGGTSVSARNLISGNSNDGVGIGFSGSNGNVVQGNYIGVTASGQAALPNRVSGVALFVSANGNIIGGALPGARNIISGNIANGVFIGFIGTNNNLVEGNYIGTNAIGNAAVANLGSGVTIANSAQGNLVGGIVAGSRNLISGNGTTGVFGGQGVYIGGAGTNGNTVQGNYIGTSANGAVSIPNADNGVAVASGAQHNVIGGNSVGARNIISGNTNYGVFIAFVGTASNTVLGDYVGTDVTGTKALPNGYVGVGIVGGAKNNLVGGTAVGARNVISGNRNDGIHVSDSGTNNNVVQGNFVGTSIDGNRALANGASGVAIVNGALNTFVGGTAASARNIISGNGYGVYIAISNSNVVQGNYIGTNAAGSASVPNSTDGVSVGFGAQSNVIGGTVRGTGNLISGNTHNGVTIQSGTSRANVVQGNYIGTNAAGAAALPNGDSGVALTANALNNIVGGTVPGARNVISGNHIGVFVGGGKTTGNQIQGNYVGVDSTGSHAVANDNGVVIGFGATNNIVGGLTPGACNIISGNTTDGVHISDSGTNNNVVQGNYIGTNLTGMSVLPNKRAGVGIFGGAQHNLIGGLTTGSRNLVSGNGTWGVDIDGGGTNGNVVQGNYIGTAVSGAVSLPNANTGVFISGGAQGNVIGGTLTGSRNIISAHVSNGVWILGSQNNQVQGNYIGTNAAGTLALANRYSGVALTDGSKNNVIGGTTPGAGNVISGNASGVFLAHTTGNQIQGNIVGLNAAGTAAVPNEDGVVISNAATSNTVGGAASAARNTISGNRNGGVSIVQDGTNHNLVQGNVISHNGGDGVNVIFNCFGNTIRGNSIFDNGALGINLQTTGEPDITVTPNDPGDSDTGPNNLQNFPLLTAATTTGSTTTITGTLNSTPNSSFDLEFFRNTALDPSGYGEGEVYLGTTRVSADGTGNTAFSFSVSGDFSTQFFTSTATNVSTGDTSEFSQGVRGSVALALSASAAVASAARSSVELRFSHGLNGETASEAEHYSVLVNGRAVTVQSVAYDAMRARVVLGLAEGTLTPGSEVVVHWHGLRDIKRT